MVLIIDFLNQISQYEIAEGMISGKIADICQNVMIFYKFVKPLATKKLKESFNF